jgi:prepilin signal peptidase PulO-like enzyme (type II secretory pathway)
LVGLSLGSFIGLVADRLPAGLSIVHGRSQCPACHRVLSPIDLVPVAGYALRRGRCARCGSPIGWRYPVLEACSALLMAGAVLWLGPIGGTAAGLLMVAALGSAAVVTATRRSPR